MLAGEAACAPAVATGGVPGATAREVSSFAAAGSVCPPAPERGTDPTPGPGGYPGQSNAVQECVNRAARRLKSGGLLVCGYRNRRQSGKPLAVLSLFQAERLLAAMLFPLSRPDLGSRAGDAGPTLAVPEAQCLGPVEARYSLIPHPGAWAAAA